MSVSPLPRRFFRTTVPAISGQRMVGLVALALTLLLWPSNSTVAQEFVVVTSGNGYLLDEDDQVSKIVPFLAVLDVTSRDGDVFVVEDGLRIAEAQVQFSGDFSYARESPKATRRVMDLLSKAGAAEGEGEQETAISLATQAVDLAGTEFEQDVPLSAMCMQYLAWLQYAEGDFDAAYETLDAAEAGLEAIGQSRHLYAADVFNTRGLIKTDDDEAAEAIRLFHEALLIQRADLGDDHMDVATILENLSYAYEAMDEWEQAARAQALSARTKRNGLPPEAIEIPESYARLAGLYYDSEQYEKALEAYGTADEYFRKYHDEPSNIADVQLLIGDTFAAQENYDAAEKAYVGGLPVLDKMEPEDALAWRKAIINRQGLLDFSREAYVKALIHYAEAKALYDPISPTGEDGDTFENIGDAYAAVDDKQKAKPAYYTAVKIFAETDGEVSDTVSRVDNLIAELDGATDGTLDDVVLVGEMPAYMFDDDGKLLTKVLQLTVLDWNAHTAETETRYGYYTASANGEFGNVDATQLRSGRMLPGYFEASADDFKTAVNRLSDAWNALLKNDAETATKELDAAVEHCKETVGENSTLTLWVQIFQIRALHLTDGPEAAAAALSALKDKILNRPKGDYPIEMDAKAVAGDLLLLMGEPEAAAEKLRAAQEIAIERLGEYHSHVMELSGNLSKALLRSGDVDGAVAELRRALAISEGIYPDDAGETITSRLALCLVLTQKKNSVKEALEVLQEITDNADQLPPQPRILSFVLLARANMLLKRYDNARELLPLLSTQLEQLGASASPPAAAVLSDRGRLAFVDEDWDAAVTYLAAAVAMHEKIGQSETFEYGKAQLSLGTALIEQGAEQQARDQFAAAVETFSRINRTASQEAKEAASRFSKIKPTVPPPPAESPEMNAELTARLREATEAFDAGRFADAKRIFEELVNGNSNNNAPTVARAEGKLGLAKLNVTSDVNGYDTSALEEAISDLRTLGAAPDMLREALLLHAWVVIEKRQKEGSIGFLNEPAFKNAESLTPTQQVTVLCLRSRALTLDGQIPKAIETAQTALATAREAFGASHIYCHTALEALGRAQVAAEDEKSAAKTFDESRKVVRSYLNETVARQPFDQQVSFLTVARKSLHDAVSPVRAGETMKQALSWVLNEKNLLLEFAVRDAQIRQLLETDEQRDAYRKWQSSQNHGDGATLDAAVKKGSLFAEAQDQESGQAESAAFAALPASVRELMTQPIAPAVTLDDVRNSLKPGELLIEIVRLDASAGQKLQLDDWSEADYFAWFVPPAGEGYVSSASLGSGVLMDGLYIDDAIPNPKRIFERIENTSEQEAAREFQSSLRSLARLVLDPMARRIPESTKTIILSLDGELRHVPWAALPNSNTGHLLIEDYAIRYVSSGRELVISQEPSGNPGRSVILANPNFDSKLTTSPGGASSAGNFFAALKDLPGLPGTEVESRAILSNLTRYAGSPPKRLLGSDASQSAFLDLSNPKVAHLATHAVDVGGNLSAAISRGYQLTESHMLLEQKPDEVSLRNPLLRCGLALAGCNTAEPSAKNDSILTAEEIVTNEMPQTELVVLSGCPSDLSPTRRNLGAGLLPDAFRQAGASTVIAPIWEVEDESTSLIMSQLYQNLATGLSKTEALRQAQLSAIKSRTEQEGAAHPYFWAGFRVNGVE